jgi:FdhD protein
MVERPIHRLVDGRAKPEFDDLAEESIVTLYSNDEVVVKLLATPFDLEDLAIGHIRCEGRGNVDSLRLSGHDLHLTGEIRKRPLEDLLTAACGACTTGDIEQPLASIERTVTISAELGEMVEKMKERQPRFSATGGVHAAAVFSQNGDLLVVREDIGRHNAFDKAIGASIRNQFDAKILVLSSRIGWELVAKGVRSGVELIIAVGAISSAAESLARSSGITLVGFAASKNPAIVGDLSRIIDKPSSSR